MSLSIIVPFLNNYALVEAAIACLEENVADPRTEIIALNSGSAGGTLNLPSHSSTRVVDLPENIGGYPVFHLAASLASPDREIVGVFHSDLFVYERGFDCRIADAFASCPQLGLLGFVGSNEIDQAGGRGLGTVSNFQGASMTRNGHVWHGTPAEVHGRSSAALERAAVVDGCAMIFRRSVISAVPGGRLAVVVPDVGTSMRRYAAGDYSLDHVLPQIFGQYYSWDFEPQRHRYAYDYPRLIESLSRVPWRNAAQLDLGSPPPEIRELVGRKISTADWQMGVVLTK